MHVKNLLLLGALVVGWGGARTVGAGICQDAELCEEPCPAENSCFTDADCTEGLTCVPSCLPWDCYCTAEGEWTCFCCECAGACVDVPEIEGPPSYTIIDLGTLGGSTSVALAINNLGQVVGSADTPEGKRHAYLWDAGTMTDLGTIGLTRQSQANDINDIGQVVGISSSTGNPAFAFFWENGQITQIGEPPTIISAYGINDAGQAVGSFLAGPAEWHAFLWEDGEMTDLTETYGVGNSAADINGFGDVIVGSKLLRADGTVIALPSLGGDMTIAYSLNHLAQVVGMSERVPGTRFFHAFLWDNGKMIDLGAIGGLDSSTARDINNHGQVLITGGAGYLPGNALFDMEKGMQLLHEMLPARDEWYELSPRGLNDLAQIVGSATFNGRRRAFLMTPIRGDFDDDGDTDMRDLGVLLSCFGGPDAPVTGECEDCDVDKNGSVDLADLQAFHWVFTGPVPSGCPILAQQGWGTDGTTPSGVHPSPTLRLGRRTGHPSNLLIKGGQLCT